MKFYNREKELASLEKVLLHKSRDLQFDAGYLGSAEETEPCQSYREWFGLYPYE